MCFLESMCSSTPSPEKESSTIGTIFFQCPTERKRYEALSDEDKFVFDIRGFTEKNAHSFLEMVRIVLTGKNNNGEKDLCGIRLFKEVNSDICKVMICGTFLSFYTLVVTYNHLTPSEKEKFPSFFSYLKAHFSASRPRGWYTPAAAFLVPTIVLGGGLKILSLWAAHSYKSSMVTAESKD